MYNWNDVIYTCNNVNLDLQICISKFKELLL